MFPFNLTRIMKSPLLQLYPYHDQCPPVSSNLTRILTVLSISLLLPTVDAPHVRACRQAHPVHPAGDAPGGPNDGQEDHSGARQLAQGHQKPQSNEKTSSNINRSFFTVLS